MRGSDVASMCSVVTRRPLLRGHQKARIAFGRAGRDRGEIVPSSLVDAHGLDSPAEKTLTTHTSDPPFPSDSERYLACRKHLLPHGEHLKKADTRSARQARISGLAELDTALRCPDHPSKPALRKPIVQNQARNACATLNSLSCAVAICRILAPLRVRWACRSG